MKAKAWWLVGWVLLTAIVVAAIRTVDVGGAVRAMGSADPAWAILALLANALALPIATVEWRVLLPRGASVSWRRMFSIVALTASVSNGAPILVGPAAGMRLLATRAGLGHAGGASVLVLDQLAEGFAKIALIAAAAALVPGFQYGTLGLVLVVGVLALALASAALAYRSAPIEAWAARSSGARGRSLRFLSRTIAHLDALRRPSYFALAVALAVAKKAIEGMAIAMVAAAFGLALPLWAVVGVLAAVSLSGLVAPTPAGLGVWEAAAFLVLRAAGVEPGTALATAIVAHVAYVAPLALTGWLIESARVWSRARARVLGLGALALVGLAIHVWFVLGADALDSDRALVLLMARDFARGAWSVYFWQQNYMVAVEPLLLTPLAALGLATPLAAGFVALALTASVAMLSVRLTKRLGGATWMALLLWAVPPAVVVHHHVALYGARLACTLLAVGAFAWGVRARAAREWVGVGALAGLAYACDHLMLPWAVAVTFIAAARGRMKPFASAALVPVALDTVWAAATPALHLAGPNAAGFWLLNIPLLLGTVLPQLFGLLLSRGPGPVFEALPPIVPSGLLWPALAIPGAAALAALIVTLVHRRREVLGKDAPDGGLAARALVLAGVVALAVFVLVGGGGERWSVRYLVPLWPAVSILAALAVSRWPTGWRPLAALAALPAVFTLLADHTWPRSGDGGPARDEASAVGEAVRASGAQAVWAEYWDTYRMALLVGESPPWVTLRVIERRPDWVQRASVVSPVAYLVRREDTEVLGLLERASAGAVRRLDERDVGRYRLMVMEHSVPGIALMNQPPRRSWQMLAAVSADMLFVGALVGLWLLRTLRARSLALLAGAVLLGAAAPAPAGAQESPPAATREGVPTDSLRVRERAVRPKLLSGLPYGSDAVVSPLTAMVSRGWDIVQARNHRRDVFTYPYGRAARAVFDALEHPSAAVKRGGGWSLWIRSEVLPYAVEPNQAKWFPNYTEHLIAGGMTARMLSEWYQARGFPLPAVWGGATLMTSAVMNEIMENRGETVGSSTTVADIYVFDLGGVLLLQWDALARFLYEDLRMRRSRWWPRAASSGTATAPCWLR